MNQKVEGTISAIMNSENGGMSSCFSSAKIGMREKSKADQKKYKNSKPMIRVRHFSGDAKWIDFASIPDIKKNNGIRKGARAMAVSWTR